MIIEHFQFFFVFTILFRLELETRSYSLSITFTTDYQHRLAVARYKLGYLYFAESGPWPQFVLSDIVPQYVFTGPGQYVLYFPYFNLALQ